MTVMVNDTPRWRTGHEAAALIPHTFEEVRALIDMWLASGLPEPPYNTDWEISLLGDLVYMDLCIEDGYALGKIHFHDADNQYSENLGTFDLKWWEGIPKILLWDRSDLMNPPPGPEDNTSLKISYTMCPAGWEPTWYNNNEFILAPAFVSENETAQELYKQLLVDMDPIEAAKLAMTATQ